MAFITLAKELNTNNNTNKYVHSAQCGCVCVEGTETTEVENKIWFMSFKPSYFNAISLFKYQRFGFNSFDTFLLYILLIFSFCHFSFGVAFDSNFNFFWNYHKCADTRTRRRRHHMVITVNSRELYSQLFNITMTMVMVFFLLFYSNQYLFECSINLLTTENFLTAIIWNFYFCLFRLHAELIEHLRQRNVWNEIWKYLWIAWLINRWPLFGQILYVFRLALWLGVDSAGFLKIHFTLLSYLILDLIFLLLCL